MSVEMLPRGLNGRLLLDAAMLSMVLGVKTVKMISSSAHATPVRTMNNLKLDFTICLSSGALVTAFVSPVVVHEELLEVVLDLADELDFAPAEGGQEIVDMSIFDIDDDLVVVRS